MEWGVQLRSTALKPRTLYAVAGSWAVVNMLLEMTPENIVIFDSSKESIAYFKMILNLIEISRSRR